ncbi:hypothetical protein KDL27_06630 [Pseudomonas syringae pv. syringae]|uniref:Uncharacterized protein n=1 Tax=Pseudomonas syringae pv. syringae TaxID=321 RepID=A0AB35JKN4_PSESY|nr:MULTISPECIES: hypothetical protein [Pseudomonas syringae group]MDC3735454.1 hypothetical protein [Pseudomonas syringae pv. syringae]
MVEEAECLYEKAILKFRKQFYCWALLAIAVPIVVTIAVVVLYEPPLWISRSGAVMAGFAFLAHVYSSEMKGVLNPGGMVDVSFSSTREKYLPQVVLFGRIAIGIVLVGTAVWGFGDLLPLGYQGDAYA